MTPVLLAAVMSVSPSSAASEAASPAPLPVAGYTVSDSIGRNPDDVCVMAYRSGHWLDWLKADAVQHHAHRSVRQAMVHYCDGFIHGMKYKGQ
jgi:hypothetical protein